MITYAIPDTHGCLPELQSALTKADLSEPTTRLIFLGDYVYRGAGSAGVLTAVKALCDAHPGQVDRARRQPRNLVPRLDRRRRKRRPR